MSFPRTLGELRHSPFSEERLRVRQVKDELRDNLMAKLRAGGSLFAGIVGYDDTVVPQIVNAILSRHNFILLGLRGQAKSRILRALTTLLDPQTPYIAGCEIHDNPYSPICRRCREEIAKQGDNTAIAYLTPNDRYVEKLATPDVTIADLIGDIDPIKAAKGGHELGSELTVHYGLLPRANRGIFAVNELPDLAGKIQVGLFNIMQEGDVQIKGYPVRLPLDVALVFSANPEDYTARGKIITPLKDRIGSEVRTHYPATVEEGIAITTQEAWVMRDGLQMRVPPFVREVIERIAFSAREDKKIDKRSGVSQRLPISVLENVISNAERRAIRNSEDHVVPRISDIYAAMPAITGIAHVELTVRDLDVSERWYVQVFNMRRAWEGSDEKHGIVARALVEPTSRVVPGLTQHRAGVGEPAQHGKDAAAHLGRVVAVLLAALLAQTQREAQPPRRGIGPRVGAALAAGIGERVLDRVDAPAFLVEQRIVEDAADRQLRIVLDGIILHILIAAVTVAFVAVWFSRDQHHPRRPI